MVTSSIRCGISYHISLCFVFVDAFIFKLQVSFQSRFGLSYITYVKTCISRS